MQAFTLNPSVASGVTVFRPYSRVAPFYDCTVGMEFFLRVRQAFSKLVPRYGIRFCSAADIGCGTGLFACYLNQCWGVPVYGVDRSLEMLRQARRNCPGRGHEAKGGTKRFQINCFRRTAITSTSPGEQQ